MLRYIRLITVFCAYALLHTPAFSMESEKCEPQMTTQHSTPSKTFTLPQIPSMLTTPKQRADYLVMHYWDNFDFADKALIKKPEITEQALVDFLDIIPHATHQKATEAIKALVESASVTAVMMSHFVDLLEKYLASANSPFVNEELFIPVLNATIDSPLLDDISKLRPRYLLEIMLKNRVGEVASDFEYTLPGGANHQMHDLKSEYVILFFNTPDCHDCQLVKQYMMTSPVMDSMIINRELLILAIYPDSNTTLWGQTKYTHWMINGHDPKQTINQKQLYDLRSTPKLYLLDKNKKVILKNASIETIEAWLMKNNE